WDNIHPDDLKSILKFSKKIMAVPDAAGTTECRYKCKDGAYRWIEFTGTNLLHDLDINGLLGNYHDTTDRKQSVALLKSSQERFITVLNSIDATIYVSDMDTYEILFMNQYMIKSFGRDMTGDICYDAFRGKSNQCLDCPIDELVNEDGTSRGVHVWQAENPITKKWYVNYDRAIEWIDGRLVKIQIATDITHLKQMEEELRQAHKIESIGTLAGGIAHDFNNILFPIVGYTEMLIEDVPEDSPFRQSLNEIHAGALRAKELVKQILTFSRQESRELKLMKMQPIIKEVLKLIRSAIPTTIDVQQDIHADCGVIKADPTQIHQIIMNLATNAYHSMEETGGVLKVSLKEIEFEKLNLINPDMTPGKYACLTVSDTGTGMDKDLTEKIFDPFFTTKEKGKGTGMGLSVVHGIVKSIKGNIHVRSEPGKGTEFNVCLPLQKRVSEKQASDLTIEIQKGTESILLIDDEKSIITMEKYMLERLGYNVTSLTNSIEALQVFRDNPNKFDVIITDMAMPNLPGDKLAVKLRQIRPDIPVLLCTGFNENISREKAASLGIKGFLLKPIIMKDLFKKIREVLDEDNSLNIS
ncbi:MAG: response regulator, partial [Desulfobacteraceae bacterium]|nr:response regulator [Desulfobacteraceae bacterium]